MTCQALVAGFWAEGHLPWLRTVSDGSVGCCFAPWKRSQLIKYRLGLSSDEKQDSFGPSAYPGQLAHAYFWEAGSRLGAGPREMEAAASSCSGVSAVAERAVDRPQPRWAGLDTFGLAVCFRL